MHVAVVGAGISGLMAAGTLVAAGHDVTLLDKGRSVGGRLATRRIGNATLDHGAQFFTIRSDEFAAIIEPLTADGTVVEWCRGFSPDGDGYPRYIATGGMNALAKRLAVDVLATERASIRCATMAFAVRPRAGSAEGGRGWTVVIDDGSELDADALVLSCPVPQSWALLITSGVELPAAMMSMEYDRTIALLAVLDRAGAVPDPGGVQGTPDGFFSFVADNHCKGVSATHALTLHANAAWSEAHWNERTEHLDTVLRHAAAEFVGDATIVATQVKKWRYATPRVPWPQRCWTAMPGDGSGAVAPVVLAGDAFGGPKVEGAALSGTAAGRVLIEWAGRR